MRAQRTPAAAAERAKKSRIDKTKTVPPTLSSLPNMFILCLFMFYAFSLGVSTFALDFKVKSKSQDLLDLAGFFLSPSRFFTAITYASCPTHR